MTTAPTTDHRPTDQQGTNAMTTDRTATADRIAADAADRIAAAEYAAATAAIAADAARRRCGANLKRADGCIAAAMATAIDIAERTPLLANATAARSAYAATSIAADAIAAAMAGGGGPIGNRIAYAAERASKAYAAAAEYATARPHDTDAIALAVATANAATAMDYARIANAERTTAIAEYTADRRAAERIANDYAAYTIAAARIAAR